MTTATTDPTTESTGVCFHYRHWPASIGKPLCKCLNICAGNEKPIGIRRFDLPDPPPQQND